MSGKGGPVSLAFLPEPAMVLRPDAEIVSANGGALRTLGADAVGRRLFDFTREPPDEVVALLRRASGTNAPLVGALTFGATPESKARLQAARLGDLSETLIVLRLLPDHNDQFQLLTRRVRELDAQLRLRLQEKATLEAALADNQALLEELQHRVKNNIQMMMTLIRFSARGRASPDVLDLVDVAQRRLQAMAASQEALYRSRRPGAVAAKPMLEEILEAFRQTFSLPVLADIGEADIPSEHAHCLALIFEELLATAGRSGAGKPLRVAFRRDRDGLILSVARDVPALQPADEAADLTLLQPLARQMRGEISVETGRRLRFRLLVPAAASVPA